MIIAKSVNWAALAVHIPKDPKTSAGFDEIIIWFETTKGALNTVPARHTLPQHCGIVGCTRGGERYPGCGRCRDSEGTREYSYEGSREHR